MKWEAGRVKDVLGSDKTGPFVDQECVEPEMRHGPCTYDAITNGDCEPQSELHIKQCGGVILEGNCETLSLRSERVSDRTILGPLERSNWRNEMFED